MLILLLTGILVSNAVTLKREKSILYSRVVISGLAFSSLLVYNNLHVTSLGSGIGIYGGLFNVTAFTLGFNLFILLIALVILILTAFLPRKVAIKELGSPISIINCDLNYDKNTIANRTGESFRIIEYPLVTLFVLSGSLFLMSTGDLISIFLAIELQSYGLYILCSLYRDSESSTGSALTYFLLGGLSSCFILLGSALLYANSGTTSLDNIYIITSISDVQIKMVESSTSNYLSSLYLYQAYFYHVSLIIMVVGFLFKISAAPFHFWSPDVYDGIPTIVTTFVAIIGKISIFAFFLELVYYTEYSFFDFSWSSIFLFSSLFSLIVGSVLGLSQFRIKRLFAYSTISHVGFILLALSINTTESISAYIFYILQYSLSNLNAFILLVTIGYTFYLYVYSKEENKDKDIFIDKDNSPIQLVSQIKGYFYINPYISISLGITLFSFVGIPPLIGFFAKQMVLSAALDSGYVFMSLVAIITSVIGAVYYLNLIKQIFFFNHDYSTNPAIMKDTGYIEITGYISNRYTKKTVKKITFSPESIKISSSLSSVISIITLLLILFIYMPSEWFNVVSILTLTIFKS